NIRSATSAGTLSRSATYPSVCTNWIPAAKSWPTAAPACAARRRWLSCVKPASARCTIWPEAFWPGPTASIRRCRSTNLLHQEIGEHPRAPLYFLQPGSNYLVESADFISADSLPKVKANFLPANRISLTDLLPSVFLLVTTASLLVLSFRVSRRAGAVATTLLPCLMLNSTFGPAPSHCT